MVEHQRVFKAASKLLGTMSLNIERLVESVKKEETQKNFAENGQQNSPRGMFKAKKVTKRIKGT